VNVFGNTSRGVNVEGVISDESLPFEGGSVTQDLSEINEIYLQARGPEFEAALGDVTLDLPVSSRSLGAFRAQGVRGEYATRGLRFRGGLGFEKGVYRSLEFRGEDGKQGPYRLLEGQELGTFVVQESERVHLDGIPMERGRDRDYVVDYVEGTLTFTPVRVITGESRISVDFQVRSERTRRAAGYLRNRTDLSFGVLTADFTQEEDDRGYLVSTLDPDDLERLEEIGDTARTVYVSGARFVGAGQGSYVETGGHFEYVGPGEGEYEVSFLYRGPGEGSYEYDYELGGYVFVGEGLGLYEPLTRLELPVRERHLDLSLESEREEGIQYAISLSGSDFDGNLVSAKDDRDNLGGAYEVGLGYRTQGEAGALDAWVSRAWKDDRYEIPGRGYDLLESDRWLLLDVRGQERARHQAVLRARISDLVSLSGEMGRLRQGTDRSSRDFLEVVLLRPVLIEASREAITRSDTSNRSVLRYRGTVRYPNSVLIPEIRVFQERNDSARVREGELVLSAPIPLPVRASVKRVENRDTGEALTSIFHVAGLTLRVPETSGLSASLTYHYLDKRYLKGEGERRRGSLLGLLWRYRFGDSELFGSHRINGDQVRRKEERFYFVGEGQGSYSYDPGSGRYYLDEFGAYRREIVVLDDEGDGLTRDHQVGGQLRSRGLLALDFDLVLKERRRAPFPPVYSFTDRGLVLRDLAFYSALDLETGTPVSPFASFGLGRVRDLELSARKSRRDREEIEVGSVLHLGGSELTLGGAYENRREGYVDLVDEERVRTLGGYLRLRVPVSATLFGSVEGRYDRHEIDEFFGPQDEQLTLDVLALKPGLDGRLLPGWTANVQIGLYYGRSDRTPPDILYLTFPLGRFLDYRLSLRRAVSETLTLTLDLSGEVGDHRERKERITLSARASF
jgi:hypothetical protein